ncbi:hypothetical protein ISF_05220 [Cordyceps fumosorosea ARSEF 2679]|uniref:DUF7514 domain-containing protein n=1 Tax=Cordyceps fumosorosea (strain ARSEF 2679) TaxID=1081104 RepID=A0A167V4C7_CORFA|nr:hypothetical protein ISF_05220 [Cordyceps fumosorosea ARSEF 2679]OAA62211.1 hypothetical protein ISF_05220 [Cordyceps fumosorosea ARSEF 2679]
MATPPSGGTTPGSTVRYCYMFEDDKRPTKQLDALLRAIAMHIVLNLGDRNEMQITPKKLAAFYKTVGGDYDSIFLEMPDSSISYIWQVTGCQHTLQPTDNDYAPPSIPALTPRGFCRWESVEILLGPEEHVPFLQFAVKNWNLRHPETGESFPPDLPSDVFPSEADEKVDLWHKACGERLTREAAGRPARATRHPKREQEPEAVDPKFAETHSRNQSQSGTPRPRTNEGDYFGRSFSYVNAPPNPRPPKHGHSSRSPEKPSRNNRSFNDRSVILTKTRIWVPKKHAVRPRAEGIAIHATTPLTKIWNMNQSPQEAGADRQPHPRRQYADLAHPIQVTAVDREAARRAFIDQRAI